MLIEKSPGHREPSESHQFVLGDVVDALESAGLPDEIKDAVRETLEGGTGRATELSDNARVILEKRYLRKDDDGNFIETPEGLFRRISSAVAEGEQEDVRELWGNRFYDLISSLKFLPNSPTLVNAGTGRGWLSACFVVSPSDDMESIMQVAHDAAPCAVHAVARDLDVARAQRRRHQCAGF